MTMRVAQGPCDHAEVRPPPGGPQKRDGRAAAASVAARGLVVAGALLGSPVVVGIIREAGVAAGDEISLAGGPPVGNLLHPEETALAPQVIAAFLVVLGAPEVRQHVIEAPTRVAELAPVIVVLGLPPDIEQPVDGTAAAENMAAGPDDATAVDARVGRRLESPREVGVVHDLEIAHRDMDPQMPIVAAGLQQEHLVPGVLR